MQKLIQRSKEFFTWLNDVMHPIKSAEMQAKWQEDRKPIVLFFLIYSLVLRVLRFSIIRSESNAPIEELRKDSLFRKNYPPPEEGKFDEAQEQYQDDVFWVLMSMGATAFLTLLMIFGVHKSRLFLYIIPWVILVDKWIEYPIRPILSAYLYYGLAFFSQSSIFQVALFGCSYFYETAIIFIVLEFRSLLYLHETFGLGDIQNWVYSALIVLGIVFCFLQWVITNRDQRGFVNTENLREQMVEFKEILSSFPEGILMISNKKKETKKQHKGEVVIQYINKELKDEFQISAQVQLVLLNSQDQIQQETESKTIKQIEAEIIQKSFKMSLFRK